MAQVPLPPGGERVLRPHTQEGEGLSQELACLAGLEASHPRRGRLGHSLCCQQPEFPTLRIGGGGGHVPAETSLVWNSEWHLHSILVHMKSTEALYSSFRLSGMEMRI